MRMCSPYPYAWCSAGGEFMWSPPCMRPSDQVQRLVLRVGVAGALVSSGLTADTTLCSSFFCSLVYFFLLKMYLPGAGLGALA